ncbi:MAG: shikimate dehydrogenase [Muribaculaceae bacterium]|nr:shikimate dehydrogenase [Muribaculaceae bacterium]
MMKEGHRVFGIIGYPLGHSFSRKYFTEKFATEGIDAEYLNFELEDIDELMEVISEYPLLVGLNVTIPYKQQVIPYLTEMDSEAAEIGAVNVIKISHDPEKENVVTLKGYNTDVIGFRESIAPLLKPIQKKALILGTGGASKAVAQGLKSLGVGSVFVSRTQREGVLTYSDLTPEVMASHLVVVNATPVGMYPNIDESPDIPYSLLTPEHLCYDVVYNPEVTEFMRRAQAQGAEVKNGREMLLLQAQSAWKIWNE